MCEEIKEQTTRLHGCTFYEGKPLCISNRFSYYKKFNIKGVSHWQKKSTFPKAFNNSQSELRTQEEFVQGSSAWGFLFGLSSKYRGSLSY